MICHYKSNPAGKKGKIKCKKVNCAMNCVGEENCDYIKKQKEITKRQLKEV